MVEQWLSIIEYARQNNISDMTVRRRIKNGRLNAVLRDGKYYIPLNHDGSIQTATPQTQPSYQNQMPMGGGYTPQPSPNTFPQNSGSYGHNTIYPRDHAIPYKEQNNNIPPGARDYNPKPDNNYLANQQRSATVTPKIISNAANTADSENKKEKELLSEVKDVLKDFIESQGELKKKQKEEAQLINEKFDHQINALETKISELKQVVKNKDKEIEDLKTLITFLEQDL